MTELYKPGSDRLRLRVESAPIPRLPELPRPDGLGPVIPEGDTFFTPEGLKKPPHPYIQEVAAHAISKGRKFIFPFSGGVGHAIDTPAFYCGTGWFSHLRMNGAGVKETFYDEEGGRLRSAFTDIPFRHLRGFDGELERWAAVTSLLGPELDRTTRFPDGATSVIIPQDQLLARFDRNTKDYPGFWPVKAGPGYPLPNTVGVTAVIARPGVGKTALMHRAKGMTIITHDEPYARSSRGTYWMLRQLERRFVTQKWIGVDSISYYILFGVKGIGRLGISKEITEFLNGIDPGLQMYDIGISGVEPGGRGLTYTFNLFDVAESSDAEVGFVQMMVGQVSTVIHLTKREGRTVYGMYYSRWFANRDAIPFTFDISAEEALEEDVLRDQFNLHRANPELFIKSQQGA